jgi:hypothetical protein
MAISTLVYLLFFLTAAVCDLYKKSVPVLLFILALLTGIPCFFYACLHAGTFVTITFLFKALLRFLPGCLLLGLSFLTKGALGIGDGLFLVLSALFLSFREILILLLIGIFVSAIVSILMILPAHFRKKSLQHKTIPFIPCMLPALILLLGGSVNAYH